MNAGIGFAVKTKKKQTLWKSNVKRAKENGAPAQIVGIEVIERGIPRTHYPVFIGEEKIGEVTSGTQSPTLRKALV